MSVCLEDNSQLIKQLLKNIGEDPSREGLLETPLRVKKAWDHWTSGYAMNAEEILKTFEDGANEDGEMVIVKNIPFYTHCEHHMAPFFGTASVAYIPNGKIVGLSKLSRLVDMYARRLQVQERLTSQIADSLYNIVQPVGVGVYLSARHLCMESRGICQQGATTQTTALRGIIKTDSTLRGEFMKAVKID